MAPQSLSTVFDPDRITKLAGVRVLARATVISATDIEDLREVDGRLTATVRGTMPYTVAIWVEGTRRAAYSCTCPQGDDGRFCKHAAAVALTLHGGGRQALRPRRDDPARQPDGVEDDPVFEFLVGLGAHELALMVHDAAQRDPRTVQRIEARVAGKVGVPTVDVREWRKAITAAFGRPSRFVEYREAPRWADGVHEVLAGLGVVLDDGEAEPVVALAEYAFERVEKATQYVDDDGWIVPIADEIGELHLAACRAARPEPVALARRLVELDLRAELDTFRRAAFAYADVLGDEGLAEYRRLVEPAYLALEPQRPGQWSSARLHLTGAMLGLARAADDVDEFVRIRTADRQSPHDYEEIVAVLTEAGRVDEAVEWARKGVGLEGREFQKRRLRDQLVGLLVETDPAAALDERWAGFRASPSLPGFKELLAQAGPVDGPAREATKSKAVAWLRERAAVETAPNTSSVLVETLLYEGEVDEAWAAATAFGCHERWWLSLARARERDHPLDAIGVYQREVEGLIAKKNKGSYRDAAALMTRVQALYSAADDDGWEPYLAAVATRHRPKTSLMARFREAGWA